MREFFRQSKQNFARIVDPMRRIFVTYDGKSTTDSSAVELLEVAYTFRNFLYSVGVIFSALLNCFEKYNGSAKPTVMAISFTE